MNPRQNLNNLQRAQHGGALILMVLILVLGVAAVMMSSISTINTRPAVVLDPVTKQGLVAAKEGLITWASMRGIAGNTPVTPGMLPYSDRVTGGYDGRSDCALSGPTLALSLGKLPVAGEKLPCRSWSSGPDAGRQILDARDSSLETIWFAASPLLQDSFVGLQPIDITSHLLSQNIGWLTVCDQGGNLLSDQVAFVVIAPGGLLPGQNRAGVATPSNFLDAYPLTGAAPCNSPTESNFDGNRVYIANSGKSTQFNDQLMYVTKNEFFTRVVSAVAKHITQPLQAAYVAGGSKFPYAASGASAGSSVPGLTAGFLPITSFSTGIGYMLQPTDPWYAEVKYSVDPTQKIATLSFLSCPAPSFTYTGLGVFTSNGKKC